ncbi:MULTISPECIES: fimbrial protein [Serratia]|uniref:fimbrial protein n=1 Tax=Serratia TaxID=613 RepID=UPI000C138748|nr:fimbrial protein [Serratia marcescens]MDP8745036.1 fimbrial protein [Serratia marcescens]PHY72107.1 exotoxin [Serratia marcescens]PIC07746.1 exotoxin [Serratia marcescens]CAI2141751.1 Major MR/P fimbria protein precursor [Serratia marcescens]HAT2881040.1 type 1 fimbrial protein [Serratia marcescens]
MNRLSLLLGGLIALSGGALFSSSATAAENLIMRGTLVDAPCLLRPGDENLVLDFGDVIDKFLYRYGRTPSKPFELHLEGCEVSVFKNVRVTFQGTENSQLPGLLALDAGSMAQGIAIGMESNTGRTLPINVEGPTTALQTGNTVLGFQAYIQGEPAALNNRKIAYGPFRATAIFVLDYI